ncbi:MAG TPA: hypothetical protein PKZ12_08615, partial [Smithellaceae bacterium]|nr:hypothetical protein [Smithellaceae bacterium]
MTKAKALPTTLWKIRNSGNKDLETLLGKEFGINPIVAQILTNRDIVDLEGAHRYLSPSLNDLYSPFLL